MIVCKENVEDVVFIVKFHVREILLPLNFVSKPRKNMRNVANYFHEMISWNFVNQMFVYIPYILYDIWATCWRMLYKISYTSLRNHFFFQCGMIINLLNYTMYTLFKICNLTLFCVYQYYKIRIGVGELMDV